MGLWARSSSPTADCSSQTADSALPRCVAHAGRARSFGSRTATALHRAPIAALRVVRDSPGPASAVRRAARHGEPAFDARVGAHARGLLLARVAVAAGRRGAHRARAHLGVRDAVTRGRRRMVFRGPGTRGDRLPHGARGDHQQSKHGTGRTAAGLVHGWMDTRDPYSMGRKDGRRER